MYNSTILDSTIGKFLGRIHGSLLKPGLPLVKDVLKPLAKVFWYH